MIFALILYVILECFRHDLEQVFESAIEIVQLIPHTLHSCFILLLFSILNPRIDAFNFLYLGFQLCPKNS